MPGAIHIAENSDIPDIMYFIDRHWSVGHVLSRHKELLHWQYYNQIRNKYNFIMARDAQGRACGLLGFIPTYHYDAAIADEHKLIWLALWKVREGPDTRGLGLKLLFELYKFENTQKVAVVGLNREVMPLYRALKFATGSLDHYYILNYQLDKFSLAAPQALARPEPDERNDSLAIRNLDEQMFVAFFEELGRRQPTQHPLKTAEYYLNRYLRHPFYVYQALGIFIDESPETILFYRAASWQGREALRIVELVGPTSKLRGLGAELASLLNKSGAEFIDLHCFGLAGADLIKAGFKRHEIDEATIIPNLFEPFVRKNSEINFAYSSKIDYEYRIFKGDGDQDRPNMI